MRRIVWIALAATLLAGSLLSPVEAAKKKKKPPKPRTASAAYASPAAGVGGVGGVCTEGNGCVTFGTSSEEAFVKVEGIDASGQPVFLRVGQDDPSGSFSGIANVCGSSAEAIPIMPGQPVQVFIYSVGVDPPCPGPATSGTVEATFSATD